MYTDGPAKLEIEIESDWLFICFTFVTKSRGRGIECLKVENLVYFSFLILCLINWINYFYSYVFTFNIAKQGIVIDNLNSILNGFS